MSVKRSRYLIAWSTVLILVALLPFHSIAKISAQQPLPLPEIRRITEEIHRAGNDSVLIVKTFDLVRWYSEVTGDDRMADSVALTAVSVAEESHRPALMVLAANLYAETGNLLIRQREARRLLERAFNLVEQGGTTSMKFRILNNLVAFYLAGFQYSKAEEYAYMALSLAGKSGDPEWKARCYLDIGKCQEGKNQKVEAFRNYLSAVEMANAARSDQILAQCYDQLSRFFNLNHLYDKAIQYKLLQIDLLVKTIPIDSTALAWTSYDLHVIDVNAGDQRLSENQVHRLLAFAERRNNRRLFEYEMALFRKHLLETDQTDRLYDLYHHQYPQEMGRIFVSNPALYFRLKAYFCEHLGLADSAQYYFDRASVLVDKDPNMILRSNFHHRFGQFLVRSGKQEKAIGQFSQAYDLASSVSYFDYMLKAADRLESLYVSLKDFRNAWLWTKRSAQVSDSLDNMAQSERMLMMELDHESRQREQATEAEQERVVKRHTLQYTAIVVIIITVFIILLMLGSLKVPEWIIRMLGFFSFIFLFEFIILVADHKIHEMTHGEPWKVLLIKIFLIAVLLPLHHWVEKRVVTFLLGPGLTNISRYPLRSKLVEKVQNFGRKHH